MLSWFYHARFGVMFCSMVPSCDTRIKLLDCVDCRKWSQFFNRGTFECNIAYRRSVALLCIPYTIRSNPMHPLYGVLAVLYVPELVIRGVLATHRYTFEPPSCKSSQYRMTLIPMHRSVSLYSMVWD